MFQTLAQRECFSSARMGSRGTYLAAAAPPDARLIAVEDGPQEPTAPDILPVSFDLSSCREVLESEPESSFWSM